MMKRGLKSSVAERVLRAVYDAAYNLNRPHKRRKMKKRGKESGKKLDPRVVALLRREPPRYHTQTGLVTCTFDHAGLNDRGQTVVFWNCDQRFGGRIHRTRFMWGLCKGVPKQLHVFDGVWLR